MFEIDTTDVNYQVAYSYVLTLWGVILIFAVYYQATRLSLYYSRKDMLRLAAAAAKSFAVHETSLSSPAGLVVPKVLTAPKRSFEARRPTVSPRSPFRGWLQRSPNASAGAANQHRITDTALDASHLLLPPDPTAYFSARVFVYQVMNYSFRVSTVSDIVTVHQAILLLLYLWTNLIFIIASPFTSATTSTSLPSSSEFADRAAYLGLANFAFMVPFATRNSVFLRLVGVPFEKMITYHRWFGRTGFLLLTYHACWHVTQNYLVLQDSFKAMFGTFQFGYGACTYISLLFLAFFSHEFFRRRYFEIFYITHFLGFYFFILFGSNHNDAFLPFMSIGIFLWLVDRCVRFYRSWIEPMRVVEIKPVQGEVTRIIFEKGAPGSSGENRAGQSGQLVGFVRGMFGGWGWRFKPGQYVFVSIGGEALSRGQGGWIKWMGWMRWHPATVSGFANPVLGGAYGEEDDDDVDTNYEQFQLAQDQLLTENAMPMQGLSPPLPPPGMFGGMGYHGFAYTPQNVVHEELEMQDIHPTYHPCANGITSPDPYVPPDETSQTIQHQHSPYHHHQYQNSQSSVHTRPVSFATVAGSPHHQQQNSSSSTHMPSNSLAKNRRPSVPLRLGRSQTTRSAYSTHPSATSGFFASVHIKALGNHTRALYDTLSTLSASSGIEDNEKYLTQSNALAARVPVRVDGPYGLPTVEFQDHKVAVLMACGIGITPMMALARDLVVRRTEGVETVRTEEVWVIWSVPDQGNFIAMINFYYFARSPVYWECKMYRNGCDDFLIF